MVSFVMIISWVLLQMSTVVLLDSFTKASMLIQHEEEEATYNKRSTEAPLHPTPPPPHPTPTPSHTCEILLSEGAGVVALDQGSPAAAAEL